MTGGVTSWLGMLGDGSDSSLRRVVGVDLGSVEHLRDRLVALASLEHLGAAVVVPSGWTHSAIGEIAQTHPKAVLAG
jgi:hypothetical protein